MTLGWRNPATIGGLERLVSNIHVVIENAKPGAMEIRGFGDSHSRELAPKMVWCAELWPKQLTREIR